MNRYLPLLSIICCILVLPSCSDNKESRKTEPALFTLLTPAQTKIDFINKIEEGPATNVMMYEYFYNGGGVAIGDINNDGLDDLYFSSNMQSNKLFLNKGNMQFEDITEPSGAGARNGPWKTGVSMADVNGDGLLDIYVCYSGNLRAERLIGQLLINKGPGTNGIPRFEDRTKDYGLAFPANSTQAMFFDFDKDSDLDLFLLNHNPNTLPPVDEVSIGEMLKTNDSVAGFKLYENKIDAKGNVLFKDVTSKSGLHTSSLNYGLGVGVSDVNDDGWPDIYISNDYIAPDRLYINNKNGTFTDQLQRSMGHTSHFSMGNDIADINNDGLQDIFSLDMLPEDNKRQKLLFAPDNYERFNLNLKVGFHYQYMRNMLHLNNGNGTFSEIGQLSGISNTDWSWAALFADYDNDGWKDLFVTNGYLRDFTNQDFVKYMSSYLQNVNRNLTDQEVLDLIHKMPASDVVNYIFRNEGSLQFSNKGKEWGMIEPSNSNGAGYSDLDNDGDLDLVINNINKEAFIYRNETSSLQKTNYLSIKLAGDGYNKFGIGAKVKIFSNGQQQVIEQMPIRGYQSSVSPVLHFGLGNAARVDSLIVIWNSGKQQTLTTIPLNKPLVLTESNASLAPSKRSHQGAPVLIEVESPIEYQYSTASINDFKRQPLLVNPLSFSGPCMAKADINKDGLEDIFIGGGNGTAGAIFLQKTNGSFLQMNNPSITNDNKHEDADAVFFDANEDGNLDLYVVSGGYHQFSAADPLLQDRLYFGDGAGKFTRAANALPLMSSSKSCVAVADINSDGKPDLFVGGRNVPGRYPEIPESYVLLNNGDGTFKNGTSSVNGQLAMPGMVTDAEFTDLNNDNKPDLIMVGDWMPITVMINQNGKLINRTSEYFEKEYSGWWNRIFINDLNGDGKGDLVIGNNGINGQCKVSEKEPARMYAADFDNNGSVDPIFTTYIQGKSYPYISRDELLDQVSYMRGRYPDYKSYADATVEDIFSKEELKDASVLKVDHLHTMYFVRSTANRFVEHALPVEVQFAPVFTITAIDHNNDKAKDLVLGGNIVNSRLRFGRFDANFGILLTNDGKGNFSYVPQHKSGLKLQGDVRSCEKVNDLLLFGLNQQGVKSYKIVD